MNTLDLNAYGVQEMTKEEMQKTNGGGFFTVLGVVLGAIGIICIAIAICRQIREDWASLAE